MLASSQKVGRKDLPPAFFFFLISFPLGAIISNDEVGEAGRLAGEWAGGSVVTGSLLETSPAFFLDKRPLTVPPLAFFSWALANFYLLNLVVIPERMMQKLKKKKRKERRRQKHVLFLTTSKFFQTLVDDSGPKRCKKKKTEEKQVCQILDGLKILLCFLNVTLTPLFQTRTLGNCKTRVPICHLSSSLIKEREKQLKRQERCTRHKNSPTTKKLRGFIQVLTKDELPITSRDKKEI